MRWLVIAALLFAGNAHAQEAAIAADVASTAAGLSMGLQEGNPLGLATLPIRLAIVQHARTLPAEEGQPILDAVEATSFGAAVSNLIVIASHATPLALVAGAAVAMGLWNRGAEKREFLMACAQHKQAFPDAGSLPCVFKERG